MFAQGKLQGQEVSHGSAKVCPPRTSHHPTIINIYTSTSTFCFFFLLLLLFTLTSAIDAQLARRRQTREEASRNCRNRNAHAKANRGCNLTGHRRVRVACHGRQRRRGRRRSVGCSRVEAGSAAVRILAQVQLLGSRLGPNVKGVNLELLARLQRRADEPEHGPLQPVQACTVPVAKSQVGVLDAVACSYRLVGPGAINVKDVCIGLWYWKR